MDSAVEHDARHVDAVALRNEDRLAQIPLTYHDTRTSQAERRRLTQECIALQEDLRATVQARRDAPDTLLLADPGTRIEKTRDFVAGGGLGQEGVAGHREGDPAGRRS